jgi:hypothetical protein
MFAVPLALGLVCVVAVEFKHTGFAAKTPLRWGATFLTIFQGIRHLFSILCVWLLSDSKGFLMDGL